LKNPDSADQVAECVDCEASEWKVAIKIHSGARTWRQPDKTIKKYFGWDNPDGSAHIIKAGEDFFHVWSAIEKEIAKERGTAGLRKYREDNEPFKDVAVEKTQDLAKKDLLLNSGDETGTLPLSGIDVTGSGTTRTTPPNQDKPKAKTMDVTDFAANKILDEAQTNLKILALLDEAIEEFWKYMKYPENGQKKGLWLKELRRMSRVIGN